MPLFVNYAAPYRTPDMLLIACGLPWQPRKEDEPRLLQKLSEVPPSRLHHLFLVCGGFRDGQQGFARRILENLPEDIRSQCDIFYREHDEYDDVMEIIRPYARCGKKVILVGHSWGAHSLVHKVAACTSSPISMLLTLDPVGRTPAPEALPQVERWLNVYIDYRKAPLLNIGNMLARIGKPWGKVEAAENIFFKRASHSRAEDMFQLVMEEVRRLVC